MKRFLGLAAALFLLLYIFSPSLAVAEESQKGYAEYEYDFGIRLIECYFWSMAEKHFNDYLKNSKIPAEKRPRGYLGLATLYKEKGKNPKATPKEREEYFAKSLENLNEFLAKWKNKDSSEYRAAQVERYEIDIDRVEARIKEINAMEAGDEQTAAQKSVADELKDSIGVLTKIHAQISDERQDLIDKYEIEHPDYDVPMEWPQDVIDRWVKIGYVLARAYQVYPTIFFSGTTEHKDALKFAITGLESFVFEHDEDTVYIVGGTYQAKLYAAQIQYEREPDKKEDIKKKVISTFKDYVFFFEPDVYQYLRESAYNELADILIALGDRALFYSVVWPEYVNDYPDWLESTEYGQGYLLASKAAVAMLENNESSAAVELLTKVIDKATLRNFGTASSFASKQLSSIIEELGPEAMDIKILLQAGRGFKGKGDWANAISYYQYVIQRLDEKFDPIYLKNKGFDKKEISRRQEKYNAIQKEIVDIGCAALSEISECFSASGMDFEAVVAANKAVSTYFSKKKRAIDLPEVEKALLKASITAFNTSRKLFYAYIKDDIQSEVIGKLYEVALANLVKTKPDRKSMANYEIGQINNSFGRYLKAIDAYKTVSQDDSKYGDSQYNICVCYFKLSTDAKDAGKEEESDKYRVQAIDSLKAVIAMERKWSSSETRKRKSWERKKSQCYLLLASIYDGQEMFAELSPLATAWKAEFAEKISESKDYLDAAIKIYSRSIKATIQLKDVTKADTVLYKELKDIVLGDNPKEIGEGSKYTVEIEIGELMIPICEMMAKGIGDVKGDPERLRYYQLELDKWQGRVKSIFELYDDFKARSKSPDLQYSTAKKIFSQLKSKKIFNPFDRKPCIARYKLLNGKDYLDTIYFTGDAKKTEEMKDLYKQMLKYYLGTKKQRVNYSMASKTFKQLIEMDPEKKLKLWRKKHIDKIQEELAYQNIRLRVLKGLSENRKLIKLADSENNKDIFLFAADCLDFLVKYYNREEYKIDAAFACIKAGKYERAVDIYADLINRTRKDYKKHAKMRYLLALNYYSWAIDLKTDPEGDKSQVKDLLERAASQLGFIKSAHSDVWAANSDWADLEKKIETELSKLK